MNIASTPENWPSKRRRLNKENETTSRTSPTLPGHENVIQSPPMPSSTPRPVLADKVDRKLRRNGYEYKPKTPSYKPFALMPRSKPFAFSGYEMLTELEPLSTEEWNTLALEGSLESLCTMLESRILGGKECVKEFVDREPPDVAQALER